MLEGLGVLIAAGARHGVEGIAEADDARFEWDRRTRYAFWITRPVPPLVVVQHDRCQVLPEQDPVQHAPTDHRVLGRRARIHLLVSLELEHSDVVEQRREVQTLHSIVVEAHLSADLVGELCDPRAVARLIAEVRVQSRDQHVGHVGEEVPLLLSKGRVVMSDGAQPGQGDQRTRLGRTELVDVCIRDRDQGADRSGLAGKRRRGHRRLTVRLSAKRQPAAAHHELSELEDGLHQLLLDLLGIPSGCGNAPGCLAGVSPQQCERGLGRGESHHGAS